MADKERRPDERKSDRPETEPYAPPRHPDVHVPEQQFEGDPKRRDEGGKERRKD